jgi:GMP synthase-like glutamine amidotransferase
MNTEHQPVLRILVLQHADWETTGLYGTLLAERHADVTTARPDLGEPLPDLCGFDAIVAMGGPMSVNDATRLPWLRDEIAVVTDAVNAGVPFFGTCLGAQILAAGLGAAVTPGSRPEFGLHDITTTDAADADAVFGGLPAELTVFQWHGEGFDLPSGATPLATSPLFPWQAIRVGQAAYGVQFHLEVDPGLLAGWLTVTACRDEILRHVGPGGDELLVRDLAERRDTVACWGKLVFARWLDVVQEVARTRVRHAGHQPVNAVDVDDCTDPRMFAGTAAG